MDPFNMPSWGSAPNYQAELQKNVTNIAPLAQNWNGAQNGVAIQQVFNKAPTPAGPSNISKFTHFIGGIGSEVGHIAGSAAHWLGQQGIKLAEAPAKLGIGLGHAWLDNMDINQINAQSSQNYNTLQSLAKKYQNGDITTEQYQIGLKELTRENSVITQQTQALNSRISADKNYTYQQTTDTAVTLITILTAGFGQAASVVLSAEGAIPVAEKTAASFLSSSSAHALLNNVEEGLTKIASNPEVFARLSPAAQKATQTAVADVVAGNAGRMTAAQIARASAANLALKYPIYYNMMSTTSQDIYKKLDDHQYGAAVRSLAFNAMLLLSGGPIGQALKYGGKAVGGVAGRTFGRSSFLDELSKGIGDGNSAGLYNAINKISDPSLRQEIIQNLSAVEATNMAAVHGNDAVAAAWRVLNGMASYEGASMSQFTHEEALNNMVNFAKAQRLADEVGKTQGLGPITVGRIDARQLNEISLALSGVEGSEARMSAWENMKAQNPNAAWANNENLDRQIQHLINTHESHGELDSAIRSIKASFHIDGFPTAVAKQLSKMGYIPIKPVSLEAPFKEGAGTLTTKFAVKGDDFFLKAVQPLPVLGSMGALLTNIGLSPSASTSRVYQLFNEGLSENLRNLNIIKGSIDKGASDTATADNIIKTLSDYAHHPTRGIMKNGKALTPITDLRQLTTKDIMEALGASKSDAKEVKGAIMDAMLQVPLKVRGLGDKLVDANYKLNPIAGRYARIQGAARFAWNPFFQAKLAYKTELLAQAEAGGKFPTLGGTNTILSMIFPDKYKEIDNVRGVLRTAGVFDEKAAQFGEGMSGEAVNDAGVASANLTHRLIPSQERSIASMVQVQADKVGMSTEDFIKHFPNEVRDTVQMIAQYDRNSEFLNSAMARTLNLAFFPFRFEYKVASIMSRNLAKANPMTQLAVINGLYRAHDFLNSPEGQAWYSHNSEVIGIINYFTPLQTLGEVASLLGGHADSIGSFGELGGLPFGWIPMMLDAQGLTNFGGVYVSPKTGQALPDYIPATDRGKLGAALQDLIGSLFTYPGATLGLPSKKGITQNIAFGITGAKKNTDFNKVTPDIPQDQQGFANTVQQLASQTPGTATTPQNVQTQPPNNPLSPTTKVPTQKSSLTTPILKPAKDGGVKKKKKGDFTPQLLPGQTKLGQL